MKHARARILLTTLAFSGIMVACASEPTTPAPTATATVALSPTQPPNVAQATPVAKDSIAESADEVTSAVKARTPVPTPTPGIVEEKVDDIADDLGLTGTQFIGLSVRDWIDVILSILIVLIGYFVIVKLIAQLLTWFFRHTGVQLSKTPIQALSRELQWLVLLILTRYAILRLDFFSDNVRTIVDDLFFVLITLLAAVIALRFIDLLVDNYSAELETDEFTRLAPVLTITRRFSQLMVLILALSVGLSHFGISNTALSVTLLVVGVLLAFGARDVVVDVMSGFIILMSQPFRLGDAIYIESLRRRGVILEIGLRTTKIRTMENREVIIPNSKIVESEVVNYAYPDPTFRLSTDLHLPYGKNIDQARQVLSDAVKNVEGVLPDRPVEVLFLGYGKSARLITIRWWIATHDQEWSMRDKVNSSMELALIQNGIEIPYPKYDLFVHNEENVESI